MLPAQSIGAHLAIALLCQPDVQVLRRSLLLRGLRQGSRRLASDRPGFTFARQIEDKRGDLKGHLLAFGHRAHRLGFEHFQLIAPGIDLDASAERKGSDDGSAVAAGAAAAALADRPAGRDAVSQVRTDEVGDLFRALSKGLEKQAGCSGLIFVGRLLQEFVPFWLAACSSSGVRAKPKWRKVSFSSKARD